MSRTDGSAASVRAWLLWSAAFAGVTTLLVAWRDRLDEVHVALTYLLLVLGASVAGSRAMGIGLAAAAFLAFNFLFLAPYGTLRVDDPRDWIVLLAFLGTGVVVAEQVARAKRAARTAAMLQATDRLKDALLASVSHDLRTPLTTIRALSHAIALEGDDRALTITEEAERLDRFVADLLDLSTLNAGSLKLSIALNAAEDVLGAALQRLEGMRGQRDIVAALDSTEPVLVGRFDFTHTLRALVNLVENALKYAPHGSRVDVIARRDGAWLLFEVSDRGTGVPADEAERIFQQFYRPAAARPDARSAGLGLAIARGLAEAQQGSLRYRPRSGGGSVFELRVPAAGLSAQAMEG